MGDGFYRSKDPTNSIGEWDLEILWSRMEHGARIRNAAEKTEQSRVDH